GVGGGLEPGRRRALVARPRHDGDLVGLRPLLQRSGADHHRWRRVTAVRAIGRRAAGDGDTQPGPVDTDAEDAVDAVEDEPLVVRKTKARRRLPEPAKVTRE